MTKNEDNGFIKPDGWNCWLTLRPHYWGDADEPRWSVKKCKNCGRVVTCGI